MKRKLFSVLTVFLLAAALYAGPIQEAAIPQTEDRIGELTLLHTNDFHGALLPAGNRGGVANVAAFVRAIRTIHPQTLLLDAGDINTGGAISNMFNAKPDILAFNAMGYDAVVFGNHEFNAGLEHLKNQIELANFPFFSSNIKTADGSFLGGYQYIIREFDYFTVGIFGITTLRTKVISNPCHSLTFINEIEAAREAVYILRNQRNVDIVIALTHMGDVAEAPNHITSLDLARTVPGIDIIVDGHSHSFMEVPIEFGRTWIVSAGERGRYVGVANMTILNGEIINFFWAPIPIGPDPEVLEILRPFAESAGEKLNEVIGEAADTFVFGNRLPRFTETALGNMIADANVWYLRTNLNQQVDFAFHNGGNIRAELLRGPVTRESVLTVLPFENYLHVVSMTGEQVIELFNFIASIPQGNGGFPQFSSQVRYTIDKSFGEGVIRDLTIGGQPVDPNRIYRFSTNDFILGGGDGYTVLQEATDRFNTSLLLSSVVIEYIRSHSPIQPALDGRLYIIGGVEF